MSGKSTEERLHLGYDLGVGHLAGGGHHHVLTRVPGPVKVPQGLAGHAFHRLPSAQDGVPIRMATPEAGSVKVEDQIVGGILHGGDLFQDHLPLQLQVLVPEEGVQDQVRENFQSQGKVLVQDPGLEAGVLSGGVGVQGASQALQRQGDLPSRALPGTLEDHVLQEVAGAHELRRLMGGPLPDPNPDGSGADPWDPLRQHLYPVGQQGLGHLPGQGSDPGAWGLSPILQLTLLRPPRPERLSGRASTDPARRWPGASPG